MARYLNIIGLPPEFGLPVRLHDSSLSLPLTGRTNVSFRIEASTNLVNWLTLSNFTSTGGFIEFTDLSATNFPGRFYRAVWSP